MAEIVGFVELNELYKRQESSDEARRRRAKEKREAPLTHNPFAKLKSMNIRTKG